MVRSCGQTERGGIRATNQDRLFADDELGLWLVADGMGGHAGGGRASSLACEAVREAVAGGADLSSAIGNAHSEIRRAQGRNAELAHMGSTIAAVHDGGQGGYRVCWVGDSRIYRFMRRTGALECLTRDHTVPGRLLASGHLDEQAARTHPQRHILTDCLGQPDASPMIDCLERQWQAGECLLVCSDGLTGELDDAELGDFLKQHAEPEPAVRALIAAALERGGRDNVTALVIRSPHD